MSERTIMILKSIKHSRLWSFAIALLMAAQVALALHSLHHQIKPDALVAGEHCTLCQVASTLAPPPVVLAVIPVGEAIAVADEIVPLERLTAAPAAAFRSRAPPHPLSV